MLSRIAFLFKEDGNDAAHTGVSIHLVYFLPLMLLRALPPPPQNRKPPKRTKLDDDTAKDRERERQTQLKSETLDKSRNDAFTFAYILAWSSSGACARSPGRYLRRDAIVDFTHIESAGGPFWPRACQKRVRDSRVRERTCHDPRCHSQRHHDHPSS